MKTAYVIETNVKHARDIFVKDRKVEMRKPR